jgi:tetratricopeptide (TPR) repeat protein
MGDPKAYDEWARQIAAGDWLGTDVFYQAPLYPYLLGALYSVAGRHLMLVRVVQAVMSAGACVLLAAAARRLFSPRVGLIAGLGLALSAPAIFMDGVLQKSSLDLFLVCLALWIISVLVTQIDRRPLYGALGAVIGALMLSRENSALLVAPLLAWVALDKRLDSRARVINSASLLLGIVLMLTPVAVRNAVVGHGFYPTTAQFGPNLYIGNHAGASGVYEALRPGRGTAEFERRDATELAEKATGRTMSPAEVSSYWVGKSVSFGVGDPAGWARVLAKKAILLVNGSELADTESRQAHAEWSVVLAVLGPVTHFGVLIPLACLGLWIVRRRWREIWIVPALAATYAISVLAFYLLDRYRFPLIPLLILFAAAGLPEVWRAWGSASLRQRAVTVAAMLAIVVATNIPLVAASSSRALTENGVGSALRETGKPDAALEHYRTAVALDPTFVEAYVNLGMAAKETGRHDEALAAFEKAVSLQPEVEDYHTRLAGELASQGQADRAIAEFREAVRLAPDVAQTHWNLGLALNAIGASSEAVASLRRAVELRSGDKELRADLADALNRLGVSLAKSGNLAGATEAFRQSLAAKPDFEDARRNLATALASSPR